MLIALLRHFAAVWVNALFRQYACKAQSYTMIIAIIILNVYLNVVLEINTSVTFFRLAMIDVKKIQNAKVAVAAKVSALMRQYAHNQQRS
jgi:hypothetical protein